MGFIATDAGDASIRRYALLYLGFGTPLRLTECDHDLVTGSGQVCGAHTWDHTRPFAVTLIDATDASRPMATLQIGDADTIVYGLFDANGGIDGVAVTIYEAWFALTNKTAIPDDVVMLFDGFINTMTKQTANGQDWILLTLAAPGILAQISIPPTLVSTVLRKKP